MAAAQLDIDANHVRVALSRLRTKGTIEQEGRGLYRLSSEAALRQTALGPWASRLERLREWSGDYVVALSAWLPKSDRKARRRRERALERLGFREVEYGFALRPHNLAFDRGELQSILLRLGFAPSGQLMLARDLSFDPRPLWKPAPYADRARELAEQTEQLGATDCAHAAVDAFLTGDRHTRFAVRDPLLPDAWVDADARRAWWRNLIDYDAFGRELWRTRVWDAAGIRVDDIVEPADEPLTERPVRKKTKEGRHTVHASMGGNL